MQSVHPFEGSELARFHGPPRHTRRSTPLLAGLCPVLAVGAADGPLRLGEPAQQILVVQRDGRAVLRDSGLGCGVQAPGRPHGVRDEVLVAVSGGHHVAAGAAVTPPLDRRALSRTRVFGR